MYDKDRVRERFLEEVERLISSQVVKNMEQMAAEMGTAPYVLSWLKTGRVKEVRGSVLYDFVTTYRRYDVTYEYILEGGKKPEAKAINLAKARLHLRRLNDEYSEVVKLLQE